MKNLKKLMAFLSLSAFAAFVPISYFVSKEENKGQIEHIIHDEEINNDIRMPKGRPGSSIVEQKVDDQEQIYFNISNPSYRRYTGGYAVNGYLRMQMTIHGLNDKVIAEVPLSQYGMSSSFLSSNDGTNWLPISISLIEIAELGNVSIHDIIDINFIFRYKNVKGASFQEYSNGTIKDDFFGPGLIYIENRNNKYADIKSKGFINDENKITHYRIVNEEGEYKTDFENIWNTSDATIKVHNLNDGEYIKIEFFGDNNLTDALIETPSIYVDSYESTNLMYKNFWNVGETIFMETIDGNLWAWGDNRYGQVPEQNEEAIIEPVLINDFNNYNGLKFKSGVNNIWGSGESIILKENDGKIWTWGRNDYGQSGQSVSDEVVLPAVIHEPQSNINKIFEGTIEELWSNDLGTYVAKDSGDNIWTWGRNDHYQAGHDNLANNILQPTLLIDNDSSSLGIKTFTDIKSTDDTFLARDENGYWWVWGGNSFGAAGVGSINEIKTPQKTFSKNIEIYETSNNSFMAEDSDSNFYGWGLNNKWQTGINTNDFYIESPTLIANKNFNGVEKLSHGVNHSVLLDKENNVYVWGDSSYGQSGTDFIQKAPITKLNLNDTQMKDIWATERNSYFLTENGDLWAIGDNSYGQLANHTNAASYIPQKISENVDSSVVHTNNTNFIKKENNNITTWGSNNLGISGLNFWNDGVFSETNFINSQSFFDPGTILVDNQNNISISNFVNGTDKYFIKDFVIYKKKNNENWQKVFGKESINKIENSFEVDYDENTEIMVLYFNHQNDLVGYIDSVETKPLNENRNVILISILSSLSVPIIALIYIFAKYIFIPKFRGKKN